MSAQSVNKSMQRKQLARPPDDVHSVDSRLNGRQSFAKPVFLLHIHASVLVLVYNAEPHKLPVQVRCLLPSAAPC